MSDFQELKIKIEAEDNVSKVLDKIKKSLKSLKTEFESLNDLDLSGLKNTLKDAFRFEDVKSTIEDNIKEAAKVVKKETKKMQEVVSNIAIPEAKYGTLISSRRTPNKIVEKVDEGSGELDLVEQVYTIIDTYEKIQDGVKTITKVITEYNADTNLETDKEVLFDITDQFEKISRVKSQLPNAEDFDLEGFKEIKSTTKELGNNLESITKKFEKVEDGLKTTVTTIDGKIADITTKAIELKKSLEFPLFTRTDLSPITTETRQLGNGNVDEIKVYQETVDNIKTTWKVINGTIRDVKTETIDLNNQTKKAQKGASKLGRFLNNIRKIILYRTIRKTLSEIVKAFKEGIQELAKFDSSFNDIMSKIVTSTAKIKASVALIFEPFINILAPIIEEISNVFTNLANSISKAFASSKGLATYTKINAQYTKDYADSLSQASRNLSFDKFEALGDSKDSIYEEVALVNDETESVITDFLNVIKGLGEILTPLIKDLMDILGKLLKYLMPILKRIVTVLKPILDAIVDFLDTTLDELMKVLSPIFDAVLTLLESIDWKTLFGLLSSIVSLASNVVQTLLNIIPLKQVIQYLSYRLNMIFTILKPLFDLYQNIWKGLAEFTSIFKPFAWVMQGIANIIKTISETLKNIISFLSGGSDSEGNEGWWSKVKGWFSNLFKGDKDENITISRPKYSMESSIIRNTASTSGVGNFSGSMYDVVYGATRDATSESSRNITVDFTGINNNVLARSLAKPIADQLSKQNIRVRSS